MLAPSMGLGLAGPAKAVQKRSMRFCRTRLVVLIQPPSTNKKAPHKCEAFVVWCPEAESNHRHADFQSAALPTELSGRNFYGFI
jgi:Pyruvate/2-oxoacid:ferredoxin oxidoreductase delta subunit